MEEKNIEEKNVKLPESVTLGGVVYTVKENPELLQFIQQVSKVEKNKLHSQMSYIKDQINNLKYQDSGIDIKALASAVAAELKESLMTKDSFKEELPSMLETVVKPVLDATRKNEQTELENYRKSLVEKNLSVCIPDLVKGNTKEELDAALAESIRLRKAYPAPFVDETAPTKPTKVIDPNLKEQLEALEKSDAAAWKQSQNTPTSEEQVLPTTPNRPSPEVTTGLNFRKMTQEEFSKNRDALEEQLKSMYGN